jgi:nicotinate-nucleotide--dimethylbenzimidazole phosphoribosyltransferase
VVAAASGGPIDLAEMAAAVGRGAQVADDEIDTGADLLIAAVASARPLHAALAAVAVLTNAEPAKVMDRGASATDPDTWMADTLAVRDLRRAAFAHRSQAGPLLAALDSTLLAHATGFVLQATARQTGVVLDGLTAAAAALIARDAAPLAGSWWLAADTAPGPGYELAITRLGLRPVLELGLARADGTAGALCVPILRAAAAQRR